MRKILLIIVSIVCLASCAAPEFIVVDKNPTNILDNCNSTIIPINKRGENFSQVILTKDNGGRTIDKSFIKYAMISCEEYNLGDTIKLTRKEFTNRKVKLSQKYIIRNK